MNCLPAEESISNRSEKPQPSDLDKQPACLDRIDRLTHQSRGQVVSEHPAKLNYSFHLSITPVPQRPRLGVFHSLRSKSISTYNPILRQTCRYCRCAIAVPKFPVHSNPRAFQDLPVLRRSRYIHRPLTFVAPEVHRSALDILFC
ncbi:hypothetical protein MJO29_004109 [Puccinia striiformis f. sp. tritici]|nr:hypothetical protein MJO29_004109 [Puccinia striiformis f. sp. tritici]